MSRSPTRWRSWSRGCPRTCGSARRDRLAADLCADARADGVAFDFIVGDEVYGASPDLREYLESCDQAYVLRVASNFTVTLAGGAAVTCAQAVKTMPAGKRSWEVRSAGKGSKGQRWYAWAWIGTASGEHSLLIRRHLKTGELAFCYCFVPAGQPASKAGLIRGSRAEMTGRGKFRVREGLLRPGPVPGPALHRDPAAYRPGHGRPRDLRRDRGPAPGPHRYPGATAPRSRPGAPARPRHDPADGPGDQADPRRPDRQAAPAAVRHPLGRLDSPPPGPRPLVPPARTPKVGRCSGQLAKCGCPTRGDAGSRCGTSPDRSPRRCPQLRARTGSGGPGED